MAIASSEGRVFGLVGLLLLVERVTAKLAAVDKFLVGVTRFVFHFVLPVHLVRVRPRPKMFPSGRSGRVGVTQRGLGWLVFGWRCRCGWYGGQRATAGNWGRLRWRPAAAAAPPAASYTRPALDNNF